MAPAASDESCATPCGCSSNHVGLNYHTGMVILLLNYDGGLSHWPILSLARTGASHSLRIFDTASFFCRRAFLPFFRFSFASLSLPGWWSSSLLFSSCSSPSFFPFFFFILSSFSFHPIASSSSGIFLVLYNRPIFNSRDLIPSYD